MIKYSGFFKTPREIIVHRKKYIHLSWVQILIYKPYLLFYRYPQITDLINCKNDW